MSKKIFVTTYVTVPLIIFFFLFGLLVQRVEGNIWENRVEKQKNICMQLELKVLLALQLPRRWMPHLEALFWLKLMENKHCTEQIDDLTEKLLEHGEK